MNMDSLLLAVPIKGRIFDAENLITVKFLNIETPKQRLLLS